MLKANGGLLTYVGGSPVDLVPLMTGVPTPRPMLAGHPRTIAKFEKLIQFHPEAAALDVEPGG